MNLKRCLMLGLILLAISPFAHAQNLTAFSAANIQDATGGTKLAAGTLYVQGTDANNTPISFQCGGGGQVYRTPVQRAVTTGAIVTFNICNPANTVPAGIFYHIWVIDTSNGIRVIDYGLVSFSGATFNFDNYGPVGAAVLPPTGGSVAGPLSVNGNLTVTGTYGNVTAKSFNGKQMADGLSGDWVSKIAAAIAALPATGGTVDATGIVGVQSAAAATLTIPSNVCVLLGAGTYPSAQNPVIQVGSGTSSGICLKGIASSVSGGASTIKNTGTGDTIKVGTGATGVRGFNLTDLVLDGNSTARLGVFLDNAGNGVMDRVQIINHFNDAIRIDSSIDVAIRDGRFMSSGDALSGTISRTADVVSATTATPYNAVVGDQCQLRGVVADTSFNGSVVITNTPTSTTLKWTQVPTGLGNASVSSAGGLLNCGFGANIITGGVGASVSIKFQNIYFSGYYTGLRNAGGVSVSSIGNIYETTTRGVWNSANGFQSAGDYFEGDGPFVNTYFLDNSGTAIVSTTSQLSTIDTTGVPDKTRVVLISNYPGAGISSGSFNNLRTDVTLVNGANNDVASGGNGFVKIIGPSVAFSVSGFTGGTDGKNLKAYNSTAFAMTIKNLTGSSAGNQISTLTGADVVLRTGTSFASFIYDAGSSKWILTSTN